MENIGRILLSKNHSNNFFDPLRVMEIKTKISKWNLIKLKSICTAKEILKINEKTTHRMGENVCK